MRSLKAVLGVVALIVSLAVLGGWVAAGKALRATGGEIYIGAEREKAIRFLMERDGLSRQDAIAAMHRYCREQGARVIDRTEIPPGAMVDFYEVDGRKPGKEQVRILGTGRALAADSDEGLAFWRIFERAARRHGWTKALAAMRELRQRGVVIAPAWFGGGATIADVAARQVTRQGGAARPVRVAVICARFPAWDDYPPTGNGQETSYSTAINPPTHYFPDPGNLGLPVQARNVDPTYPWNQLYAIIGGDLSQNPPPLPIDWYIDSPGGPVPGNGWSGTGVPYEAVRHPPRVPEQFDGPTNVALRQYWYKRMFDLNWFGVATEPGNPPAWAGSLRNYYWDNSHGAIAITGTETDIYGWIESHHVLDRLPYPTGPQPFFMVQPGTPLIRPSSQILSGTRPILRASLGEYGGQIKLTVLYRWEYLTQAGWAPPWPTLTVFQSQRSTDQNNPDPGDVTIQLGPSNTRRYADPYDNRRWTYIMGGTVGNWEYPATNDPDQTREVEIVAGGSWSLQSPARSSLTGVAFDPEGTQPVLLQPATKFIVRNVPAFTWNSSVAEWRPQNEGC
ncbi:MAG: hypothetical protein N2512_02500, partial [Armatimonadetes bacterium]|nr:hypothetical protein [Armatimonadota bacterium]